MTPKPPRSPTPLQIHGELSIDGPSDRFTLLAKGETLTLTGPSLRSFLRLRRVTSRAPRPPLLDELVKQFAVQSNLTLNCLCRGRTIASLSGDSSRITVRPRFRALMLAALRL